MVLTSQREMKKSGIEKTEVEDGEMVRRIKKRRRRVITVKTVTKG